jgi:hypothetical protein
MSASLNLNGLRELVKALDVLPQGLEDKASVTVKQAAIETAAELRSALALGPTGNLRKRVRLRQRDPLVWQVISGAPHAWLNEYGTRKRNYKGANRGVSKASGTVGKVASAQRRQMNAELEQVLVQVLSEVR